MRARREKGDFFGLVIIESGVRGRFRRRASFRENVVVSENRGAPREQTTARPPPPPSNHRHRRGGGNGRILNRRGRARAL